MKRKHAGERAVGFEAHTERGLANLFATLSCESSQAYIEGQIEGMLALSSQLQRKRPIARLGDRQPHMIRRQRRLERRVAGAALTIVERPCVRKPAPSAAALNATSPWVCDAMRPWVAHLR